MNRGKCCKNYNSEVEFVRKISRALDATSDARFSLVEFGDGANSPAGVQTPSNFGVIDSALNGVAYNGGWTNTQAAISACRAALGRGRPSAEKVIILVTDGNPTVDAQNRKKSDNNCQDLSRRLRFSSSWNGGSNSGSSSSSSGDSSPRVDATSQANTAKSQGITLIPVAIGSACVDANYLRSLGSSADLFTQTKDINNLDGFVNKLANSAACT
jgi:uncharacterized protein YegL